MNLSDAIKQIERIPHCYINEISNNGFDENGSFYITLIFTPTEEQIEEIQEPEIGLSEVQKPEGVSHRGYTQAERDVIRSASSAREAADAYKKEFGNAKSEKKVMNLFYLWRKQGKLFLKDDRVVVIDAKHPDSGRKGAVLESKAGGVSLRMDNGSSRWVKPDQIRGL